MEKAVMPLSTQVQEEFKEKRKVNFKPLVYTILVVIVINFIIIGGKLYKDYRRELAINNLFIENIYIDKTDVKASIKLVKRLPMKVTNNLIQHNVKIDYIPWEPTEKADGQFRGLDKVALIKYADKSNTNIFTKYQNEIVTLHEVAHAFDFDYMINLSGYAYSGIKEFDDIHKEEARKLFSEANFKNTNVDYLSYYINARWEYFAQCFALYYVSDETNKILREQAPKTYNFINKVSEPTEKYTFLSFLREKI